MSEAMKMEEVVADLGYDFNTDVLVARAHQLAKLESNALVEKTSSNYNLQRKVKCLFYRITSDVTFILRFRFDVQRFFGLVVAS